MVLTLVAVPALARHHSHGSAMTLDPDAPTGTVQLHDVTATVVFSPRGQLQDMVVNTVAGAKKTVLVLVRMPLKTATIQLDLDRQVWTRIVAKLGATTGQQGIFRILAMEVAFEEDLDLRNFLWATT